HYSRYYAEAEKLGFLVTQFRGHGDIERLHIVTGGGPSYMEAANRGAERAGGPSIALGVSLPHERGPNRYVTPELTFKFHYFAMRKMHFLIRAKAMVVFPGGFGTLDELVETLTLMQTGKIDPFPILIFGRDFWEKLLNFDWLVETGMIAEKDLKLFHYVETAEEAWQKIAAFYRLQA
ncbi:MAG: TIGR00730 family Rossman fold protein, partial [Gammaproteobacteria bacterium]|nr:TIGR00730 family Rossman fold protein [Gammaproteobacteria bacterium]